ncbi:patatin-like phospholipase family protein [Candidatus Berkiella aquae]|uniref:NTE family protein RssA n=1 Tax=Candidatus Berkiella aquae TaxID=295108 RepID=A0A0Q9YTQ1_9GAMM|nr:patatin-like phospholipase family protein [Candidatus Berkiella aquae]MCS5711303.1 patatin-like phospholipase family protein [Candidatus Berkiella aquae]
MKKWILLLSVLTNIATAAPVERPPKIGLVLSGGGARGAAHIGVIETLEEMNVPIDFIVGTSMGAVIGGLYASGVPIEQIKRDFSTLKWDEIFSYNIRRSDLSFRRKLDTDIFLLKNFISYSDGAIHIPEGIITGQSLYEVFNNYLLPIQPINDFNQLSIPFKAVATDIVTGKAVVLENGDMALALLASMAVPGIISPIDQCQYLLVDGGVSANVPVEIAKSMNPDVLIVVDVSTPLWKKSEIIDLAGVLDQLSNILTYRNIEKSKALLTSKDILIEPALKDIDTTDFKNFEQGVMPGRIAAENQASRLRHLASLRREGVKMMPERNDLVTVDAVAIKNIVVMEPQTYFDYIYFDETIVTPEEVSKKIDTLYGLSIFDRIHYTIQDIRNERTLVVEPIVDQESPIYFQASLLLDTDFHLTNTFGIVFAATNPRANSYLGEWRIIGQIGQGEGLAAEFYQPLSKDLAWFVNPRISIQRTPTYFYYDFDLIADLVSTIDKFGILLGRNFGHWGRLSGYWQFEYDDIKQETGFPIIQNQYVRNGEVGLLFEWDTLDNVFFPRHGLRGRILLADFDPAYGGDNSFSQFSIRNLAAVSTGKHALALGTTYNRTIHNVPTFPEKYTLGGLFELTGLSANELLGDQSALVSAIYFYQYKQIDLIPNRPVSVYLGGSLEAGKVWDNVNLSNERWVGSGSIFAAADTLLGPLYLAFGMTDNGHRAAHLALRPAFR